VEAGARLSQRASDNRGGLTWGARYQAWQLRYLYASPADFPRIDDPSDLVVFSYEDFQRGDTDVPGSGYQIDPVLLQDFRASIESISEKTPDGTQDLDWDLVDLSNANNINTQDETTEAAYVKVNFAIEDLAMPLDGNLGVRYVRTKNTAQGQLAYPTLTISGTSVQPFYRESTPVSAENVDTHLLPSLNLRLYVTDDLLVRFAASKAIWRPSFTETKALMTLFAEWRNDIELPQDASDYDSSMANFTLSAGNPYLEPMKANQYDLATEWYFDDNGGMAHLSLFRKDISDFFRTVIEETTVAGFDVVSASTDNVGTANINGVEFGVTKFFDFLPEPWDGFGVQTNFTYINSRTGVPDAVRPKNTDGSGYDSLPFEGLSKYAYNLVGIYEKHGFYTRLAWNWRSEYLVAVGPTGWRETDDDADIIWNLPVYNEDYGQLDLSMGYSITDNVSVNFQASNLTKADTKGVMDQGEMGKLHAYTYSQDVRYAASVSMTF
jgi:TonB-dependent receptor